MKRLIVLVALVSMLVGPAKAEWSVNIVEDEMDGTKSAYATGDWTPPTSQMGFPYGSTKVVLGFGAKSETNYWAYLNFTELNITGGEFTSDGSGNQVHKIRVKFDDILLPVSVVEPISGEYLQFMLSKEILVLAQSSNVLMVEIPWYDEGNVIFKIDLIGLTKATEEMFDAVK